MRAAGSDRGGHGLRIVAFNVEPAAYRLVAGWAEERGHQVVLVVTTPGPPPRTYLGHREIVAAAPPGQDVLVTTRLKRAAPLIAAVAPDLVLSYTFPYRIPTEIRAIPRLGAVNLHPSPLPRYRGPNPARMVYAGEPTIGATLHRMEDGFDTGAILGQAECPLPTEPTVEALHAAWHDLLVAALDEGVPRAAAGDPGEPQDDALASYAAAFSPEEHWLDWRWPAATLQRRTAALNLLAPRALARVDGQAVAVAAVRPLSGPTPQAAPGETLHRAGELCRLAAGDGAVEVRLAGGDLDPAAADALANIQDPPAAVAAD